MKKKSRLRPKQLIPIFGRLARFLLKSQLLTIFLALSVLGVWVGAQSRPSPRGVPYAELFDDMSVVSYRESPSDTAARFFVELSAGGRVFSEYDIESRRFLPPARGRAYSRAITGTRYPPLEVRGHVAHGLWLVVPDSAGRSLLPEQFDEMYRTTLGFVKPVSLMTGVLGTLSGYSVGYRLGTWNGSLRSHAVQQRVLATPDLGRTIAREAWRRVLLEPVVMSDEDDGARFAALRGTQRLYSSFVRLALNDSDGFIPREAARLAGLGHEDESRTMLAFAEAVRRAALDSVHVTSADFAAIERWASLLDRRGHWANGTIPPAGEERAQYLGTLAWYGLAPPAPNVDRVWVGPRVLVREGDSEGFVADDILATGVGCPIPWRPRLREENTGTSAMAGAWFNDRPEIMALVAVGGRIARGLAGTYRQLAARAPRPDPIATGVARAPVTMVTAAPANRVTVVTTPVPDSAALRSISLSFPAMGAYASLVLVTADSVAAAPQAGAAQSAIARVDSLMGSETPSGGVARLNRGAAAGAVAVDPEVAFVVDAALRVWRESGHAFDITAGPLARSWGFAGGAPHVPPQPELDAALARVGAQRLVFDPAAHTLRFQQPGVEIDLDGLARGYALDAATDTLRRLGVRDALIQLAGSMVALGAPARGESWRAGIRDPRDRITHFARLHLAPGQAVSTSGSDAPFVQVEGRTCGHILDPRTGRPAEGLISATVLASSAMAADAWSSALFVLGPDAAKRIARERADLSAVLVEPGADGVDTVWVESELKERFALEAQCSGRFRVEYF